MCTGISKQIKSNMNKEVIKEKLFDLQRTIIQELEEKINMTHSMVDLDSSDTHDPEDFSHQYESGEMETLMKVQLNKAKRNLELLEMINFDPKSKAEVGAVVVTDKTTVFIGFSMIPFETDGRHIIGISKQAPLYPLIIDKREGEKFKYAGINYSIQYIY